MANLLRVVLFGKTPSDTKLQHRHGGPQVDAGARRAIKDHHSIQQQKYRTEAGSGLGQPTPGGRKITLTDRPGRP